MIEWLGLIVVEYYGGTETGLAVFARARRLAHRAPRAPLPSAVVKISTSRALSRPGQPARCAWPDVWPD
jgi:hypothetical protein